MIRRNGFTLIELTLSLALSGLAVLLGAILWRQSLAAGTELQTHRRGIELRAGGRRWMQSAIGSIDVGAVGDTPFMGHPESAAFTSWLPTANGWPERDALTLGLSDHLFAARSSAGETIPLADSIESIGFDYLLEPGLNTTWAGSWESPVSAPLAVRVRLTSLDGIADTLLILVGPRG